MVHAHRQATALCGECVAAVLVLGAQALLHAGALLPCVLQPVLLGQHLLLSAATFKLDVAVGPYALTAA